MPVELPDEMACRVKAVAEARGVRPERVVIHRPLEDRCAAWWWPPPWASIPPSDDRGFNWPLA